MPFRTVKLFSFWAPAPRCGRPYMSVLYFVKKKRITLLSMLYQLNMSLICNCTVTGQMLFNFEKVKWDLQQNTGIPV